MDMQWTVYVQKEGCAERVALNTFGRPLKSATASDFGLSMLEGRELLRTLQSVVAQDQIVAYDIQRRHCRHCGTYRQIKDWRPRVFMTALGKVRVRVPRVVSCLCTDEPLDDDDEPVANIRDSECPIAGLLPRRKTPELAYLCAKHGATSSYRTAASNVSAIAGIPALSHTTIRRETIARGQQIEDDQFSTGWYAGGGNRHAAQHLRVAIDGTVLSAAPWQEITKFEVIAGRVECDGQMGRRFVCALPSRMLAESLVAAALEQSGWSPSTLVDVVTDGARGMRALVTSVAPRVAPMILDWFHLSMKLQAVKSPLFSQSYDFAARPEFMIRCQRLWSKIRDALWRGRGDEAMEMTRTLIASLAEELASLPPFYRRCSEIAHGSAKMLLVFLKNNRKDLVDYQGARMSGRRISSASAESVMNHVVNRRMSKRQQMRWSLKGAHCLLQTRVELLDGRLEAHFAKHFPHFRSPECGRT